MTRSSARCWVGFDGNALYRHPDIVAQRYLTE
jgi:hypothetical protein